MARFGLIVLVKTEPKLHMLCFWLQNSYEFAFQFGFSNIQNNVYINFN